MALFNKLLLCVSIGFLISCTSTNSPLDALEAQEATLTEIGMQSPNDALPVMPPELQGKWRSASPEPAGNGRYAIREFSFEHEPGP